MAKNEETIMTKKVWTPHNVKAGEEISYKGNAHGYYMLVHENWDVKALNDATTDSEVLAELTRRVEPRIRKRCGSCGSTKGW